MPKVTKATNNKKTKNTDKSEITLDKLNSSKVKKDNAQKTTSKVVKKSTSKSTTAKRASEVASKSATKKVANVTKKSTSKVDKKEFSKKVVSKSSKSKKSTTKKKIMAKSQKKNVLEYYDLPYRYNQTVVKILAQTPNTLFVYWDVSDNDREKFVKEYGEYFFNDTIPV